MTKPTLKFGDVEWLPFSALGDYCRCKELEDCDEEFAELFPFTACSEMGEAHELLFGGVEPDEEDMETAKQYDFAVTKTKPRAVVLARKGER